MARGDHAGTDQCPGRAHLNPPFTSDKGAVAVVVVVLLLIAEEDTMHERGRAGGRQQWRHLRPSRSARQPRTK